MKDEVWMNGNAELIEVCFNPCTCHPGDIILTRGRRYNQISSLSFISEEAARAYLVFVGYINLDEESK